MTDHLSFQEHGRSQASSSGTGAWRLRYAPGEWLVCVGRRVVVVLRRTPECSSDVMAALWPDVEAAAGRDDALAALARHGLDTQPDLAVAVAADGFSRCLLRGRIQVRELGRAGLLADGTGRTDFVEVDSHGALLRVEFGEPAGNDPLLLPLGLGVALCSSLTLALRPDAEAAAPSAAPSAAADAPRKTRSAALLHSLYDAPAAAAVGAAAAAAPIAALGGQADTPPAAPLPAATAPEEPAGAADAPVDEPEVESKSTEEVTPGEPAPDEQVGTGVSDDQGREPPAESGVTETEPADSRADAAAPTGDQEHGAVPAETDAPAEETSSGAPDQAGDEGVDESVDDGSRVGSSPVDDQGGETPSSASEQEGGGAAESHPDAGAAPVVTTPAPGTASPAEEASTPAGHHRDWSAASPEVLEQIAAASRQPAQEPSAPEPPDSGAPTLELPRADESSEPPRPGSSPIAEHELPQAPAAAETEQPESAGHADSGRAGEQEPEQTDDADEAADWMPGEWTSETDLGDHPAPDAFMYEKTELLAPRTGPSRSTGVRGDRAGTDELDEQAIPLPPATPEPALPAAGTLPSLPGTGLRWDEPELEPRAPSAAQAEKPDEDAPHPAAELSGERPVPESAGASELGRSDELREAAEWPEQAPVREQDHAAPVSWHASDSESEPEAQREPQPEPAVQPQAGRESEPAAQWGPEPESQVQREPQPEPQAQREPQPEPAVQPESAVQPEPEPQPEPTSSPSRRSADEPVLAAPPTADSVLAQFCPNGHPNRPGIGLCRVCGLTVPDVAPQPVQRPLLADLVTSGGQVIQLDGPVLIGRAPRSQPGEDAAVLRVQSPHHDISRTHVRVAPHEWDIAVTDMNSTNGTIVFEVGNDPVRLGSGDTVVVGLGTVIDLGDGQQVSIEAPRG